MVEVDVTGWRRIGETSNTEYYEVEPRVLAAVPRKNAIDDLAAARQNVAFQNEQLRALHGGVVLVFFDRMSFQEKEARNVYANEMDVEVARGSALIGGKAIARTLASFFMGIFKPKIPTRLFADLPSALTWARELNGQASSAHAP